MHPSSEILSAAADGELTPAERASHGAHLGACASCTAHVRSLARLDATVASAPALDCAGALAFRSAALDGELDQADAVLLERHETFCVPCGGSLALLATAWGSLDLALAGLPVTAPSARVDAHIARLVADAPGHAASRRPRFAGGLLAGAGTLGLTAALLLTQLLPTGPATLALPPVQREAVLVAGAQQVLDERTNTLYVLRLGSSSVEAIDLATQGTIATVRVGGRPTALALDPSRNTIYVLDSEGRSVTQIDTDAKLVVGTVALTLPGTPTTISVDTANGKLVIGAVSASPAPSTGTRTAPPVGHVTVLDVTTKRVDTVRVLDVAPQSVVMDGAGKRALIVSPDAIRVVDATTYASLEDLAGGVAAAFSADDRRVAVLSAGAGGTILRVNGTTAPAAMTLSGTPIALIALPDGGFAALVHVGGKGRVHVIGGDGRERGSSDVDLMARELAYDVRQARIAVLAAGGASYVSLIGAAVVASTPTAPPPSAPVVLSPSVPASSAPASAPPPAPASPSPQPSAPPAAAAPASPSPKLALAAPARQLWPGTYFVEVGAGRETQLVAGAGGRVWTYIAGTLAEVDTATGAFARTFRLPAGARISSLQLGSQYVYAADTGSGRLHVVSLATGELTDRSLPFLRSTVAMAVSGDDRLWLAMAQSARLIVYDPAAGRLEAVDVGASSITALTADRAGRLWFADDFRHTLSSFDIAKGKVTDLAVSHRGTVTAVLADRDGTVWMGTDAGELIGVRGSSLVARAGPGRPVRALAQGPTGVWYLSEGADGSRVAPASLSRPAEVLPAGLRTLAFDAQGLAWSSGQPALGGFYALDTLAPRGP